MSTVSPASSLELSRAGRWAVLAAAFLGLVFDGFELGLMPVASNSVAKSLLATNDPAQVGKWFAWFTAALMLGAAVGGSWLGNLGDRIGRAKTMGLSILFYSVFAGLGAFVQTCEQMLILRFMVGLGVGGMWPNGVALVAECWPNTSRPTVSGVLGAGINIGIVCLSILGSYYKITPDSWRWIFYLAAIPAVLGLLVLTFLPESPKWLATRGDATKPAPRISTLFRGSLLRPTLVGILLASVPLVGAWAGSKWMIPWADEIGHRANVDAYKSTTQWWWALGATAGSFLGAPLAAWLGRRFSYFLISLGATALTWSMFRLTAPLEPSFLPTVFVQGIVATLFFGWLPLYLPELFPVEVRATGAGLSMNIGRFVTAASVVLIGTQFKGDYSDIGAACALIYALGMIVVFWAPNTAGKQL
jgi:MFS transporter, SHS family, sialic acid transporter